MTQHYYDETEADRYAGGDGDLGTAIQLLDRRMTRNFTVAERPLEQRAVITVTDVQRGEPLREKLERQREELATAIGALTAQLARREAQLRELDRYPAEDPFKDGDALEFVKRFPGSDTPYTYLALRVNDLWYVTGRRGPDGVPWVKLTEWLGLGVTDVKKIGATRKTAVSW